LRWKLIIVFQMIKSGLIVATSGHWSGSALA